MGNYAEAGELCRHINTLLTCINVVNNITEPYYHGNSIDWLAGVHPILYTYFIRAVESLP